MGVVPVVSPADSDDVVRWRVFISHTSELREYPQGMSYVEAAERAVSAAGHVIVDMADFAAASQAPAQLCAERVRGCDVYMAVLGTRYGSPVADNPQLSYTELEFGAATGAGLSRLVFLLVERSLRELAQTRQDEHRALASQPVRLAPRPPGLPGRDELLAALDTRLAAGDGPARRTVALCGLAGAGKTSVAAEYAYRHLDEVGLSWQLPAEDATVLADGFTELAAELGIRIPADARGPVASVHAVLASFPVPWLLIFDNAADRGSVEAFLPPAGPGRVLITTQNPVWPPGQALDVPMLDQDVAARFLMGRTGDPDPRAARDLADVLGGLPLALEQAAAYIQATGETLAGYLALFRQRRSELLARGQPTGYSKTVASTWALAFGHLQQTEPGAVGLLRLLAFGAPDAIPLPLLLQPRPGLTERLGDSVALVLAPLLEDRLAANDAVGALRRYSLITLAGAGWVSVHRLVQAVTLDQMSADLASEWKRAAAALIDAAIPDHSWPLGGSLSDEEMAMLVPMDPKDRARYLLQKRIQDKAEMRALLWQLESLRRQTAMSVISNIR